MKSTTIEIVMAAYNGAAMIGEQLESILAQTDDDWHLTVSDDGSTDGTDLIIDRYCAKYPEKIRRVFSGKRFGGARDHFFWLTGISEAQYIAYCDDDDVWDRDKLSALRAAMEAEEGRCGAETPILVFSDQTVVDKRLAPVAPSLMRYQKQYFGCFDYRSILFHNVVTGGAMMINRALAQTALRLEDSDMAIMHDGWMAAVAARFGVIRYLDRPLGLYRQHGGNAVGAKDVSSLTYFLKQITHPGDIRRMILRKKCQANAFLMTYQDSLEEADIHFLTDFAAEKSGPLFYWKNRALIHGMARLAGMMLLG